METKNLDIYGHAPLSWSRATSLLEAAQDELGERTSTRKHHPRV